MKTVIFEGPQGCNGCLDFGQAANVGLGRIIDRMEKNYRRNQESYPLPNECLEIEIRNSMTL